MQLQIIERITMLFDYFKQNPFLNSLFAV